MTLVHSVCDDISFLCHIVSFNAREIFFAALFVLKKNRAANLTAAVKRYRIEVVCVHIVNGYLAVCDVWFENHAAQGAGILYLDLHLRKNAVECIFDEYRTPIHLVA